MIDSINELAKAAHENAVAHGFYDDPDPEQLFALIHDELSEAVEEERCGAGLWEELETGDGVHFWHTGIAEKLADFVIRLLDYAAYRKLTIPTVQSIVPIYETLPRMVNVLHDMVCDIWRAQAATPGKYEAAWGRTTANLIHTAIETVEAYLDDRCVDLWAAVREKMEYNRTREYKHGRLY